MDPRITRRGAAPLWTKIVCGVVTLPLVVLLLVTISAQSTHTDFLLNFLSDWKDIGLSRPMSDTRIWELWLAVTFAAGVAFIAIVPYALLRWSETEPGVAS